MLLALRLLASRVWGFWLRGSGFNKASGFGFWIWILDVSTFKGLELLGLGLLLWTLFSACPVRSWNAKLAEGLVRLGFLGSRFGISGFRASGV